MPAAADQVSRPRRQRAGKLTPMATRGDLPQWVLEAVRQQGGSATPVAVAKQIWADHEAELRASGDLFYTWQYDMRWAAQALRNRGQLGAKHGERTGTWDLA